VHIDALVSNLAAYRDELARARGAVRAPIAWYPYDILANVVHLDRLLSGENRDLDRLVGRLPVADIGGADGDLAFVLERACGWKIDMIDTAAANMNGLRAARALREQLGSSVEIWDIDLDAQFRLPAERYGLVLLLGILYHLQNPFFVLRALSTQSEHLLLSTRVARFAGPGRTSIAELPLAYLVDPAETNDDPTNYWMFSPAGLDRLVRRAGWTVVDQLSVGDVEQSDPSSPEHDERRFLLLRSTRPAADGTAHVTYASRPGGRRAQVSRALRGAFRARPT
jgi:tRNA (mo5U34)-methyltransferase